MVCFSNWEIGSSITTVVYHELARCKHDHAQTELAIPPRQQMHKHF